MSQDRVGLFAFGLGELSGYLVAAILGYEWGIGVRAGCFCAHPGMMHLLNISPESLPSLEEAIILGRNLGAVRASLGLYNSAADIDVLIDGLCAIAAGQIRGHYAMDSIKRRVRAPRLAAAVCRLLPYRGLTRARELQQDGGELARPRDHRVVA